MKQPKRLTREYKEAVSAYGYNAENWMLESDGDVYITIVNKTSGTKRKIDKYARRLRKNDNNRF